MAARTASVSGLWSNTATWGGAAVPVDADTVTINASVVVEFDVDQSGFTNGVASIICNGTLKATKTANSYLKCSGNVTFGSAGIFDWTDWAGGEFPVAYTAQLRFGVSTSFSVSNSGTLIRFNAKRPTNPFAKLSQAESVAATTLHIDRDLTGDTAWAIVGAEVYICNVNKAVQAERRTISSITSTTIVITAGLTNTKLSGSYVVLASRNVRVFEGSSGSGTLLNVTACSPSCIWNAEWQTVASMSGVFSPTDQTFDGVIHNVGNAFVSTTTFAFTGVLVNVISIGFQNASGTGTITFSGFAFGCATVHQSANLFYMTSTAIIAGCGIAITSLANTPTFGLTRMDGLIYGCTTGMNGGNSSGSGTIDSCSTGIVYAQHAKWFGTIQNCANGIIRSTIEIYNASFSGNTTSDINQVLTMLAINTVFGSATEVANYTDISRAIWAYQESRDHDAVAGAYRAWVRGGTVTSVASPVFDVTRIRSYQHSPVSATDPCFMQRKVLVPANTSLFVTCYIQKSVSMSYLPRLWVMLASKEPFLTGSPDVEVIMTNSTATWETLTASVTNSTDSAVEYIVRTVSKNASGTVTVDPILQFSGGISRGRILAA